VQLSQNPIAPLALVIGASCWLMIPIVWDKRRARGGPQFIWLAVLAGQWAMAYGLELGLRGLGMPAPSKFRFASGVYAAEMTGLLTSELAFALFGGTKIRAYGFLNCQDNFGNAARLTVDRLQKMEIKASRP